MLKRILKQNKIVISVGAMALTATSASAVEVLGQEIALDVTPVTAMVGAIVIAIASIWAYKKIIAFGNKS